MRNAGEVLVDGHALRLTNQSKLLWPDDGLAKADLIGYYRAVAPVLLLHLHQRPLTLKLYPDDIGASPIFVQTLPRGPPPGSRAGRIT